MRDWIPVITLLGVFCTIITLIFSYITSRIKSLETKVDGISDRMTNLADSYVPREICNGRYQDTSNRLIHGDVQFKEVNDKLQALITSVTKIATIMSMLAKKSGIDYE